MGSEARVEITEPGDILAARQHGRALAAKIGFTGSESTLIAAAISEIARNIVEHAERGELVFECIAKGRRRGLQILARDQGPGIPNVDRALEYGFSTNQSSGLGLPAAKWLMDEFEIQSRPGEGTTITMTKWLNHLGKAHP